MAVELYSFYFQHDFPGLNEGIAFYKPTIGDTLIDAWIELEEQWSTAHPALCDFGGFVGAPYGWLSYLAPQAPNLSASTGDLPGSFFDNQLINQGVAGSNEVEGLTQGWLWASSITGSVMQAARVLPAKFATDDAIKVVVSQNGHIGGPDPQAIAGKAKVYLLVIHESEISLDRIDTPEKI